jgi:hypothetical protein
MLLEINRKIILNIILMIISAGIFLSLSACESAKEKSGWSYPLFNQANHAANPQISCHLLEEPQESWVVTLGKGDIPYSLFPVATDIDNDGTMEYILSGWNKTQKEPYWLASFNLEDGSLQWKNYYDTILYWSSPIAVDMDENKSIEVIFATSQELIVLNGSDGSIHWSIDVPNGLGMTVGARR